MSISIGAAGLEKTSDGKVKVIEVRDCSGSGDVDTTTTTTGKDIDETTIEIQGVTGRKLLVSKQTCDNPSGTWHIGAKPIYEFFPSGLVKRLTGHFTSVYSIAHKKAVASAIQALSVFDK